MEWETETIEGGLGVEDGLGMESIGVFGMESIEDA